MRLLRIDNNGRGIKPSQIDKIRDMALFCFFNRQFMRTAKETLKLRIIGHLLIIPLATEVFTHKGPIMQKVFSCHVVIVDWSDPSLCARYVFFFKFHLIDLLRRDGRISFIIVIVCNCKWLLIKIANIRCKSHNIPAEADQYHGHLWPDMSGIIWFSENCMANFGTLYDELWRIVPPLSGYWFYISDTNWQLKPN